MRTWSGFRAVLLVAAAAMLACDAETPEEQGGFEGDERLTFQAEDPYAALDRVNWQPWSEKTISSAKKPILLDLSSLWCHYCHLYDTAVWSDPENARFVEENFTPVRVDADARPDLNTRYSQGGLPTVMVLTPDGYPVDGTAFNLDGLGPFLRSTLEYYESGGDSLREALATAVEELARRQQFLVEQGELDPGVLNKVIVGVSRIFDRDFGGFSPGEDTWVRFVSEEALYSLVAEVDPAALETSIDGFLQLTLDRMDEGAVHDHLFGGFFRAADDRAWTQPHFEKLLEVQAWIADAYLAAYERWGDERYREVAERTIEFALEFFGNPDGVTLANSMDADLGPYDVGGFYTWSIADVDSLLTGNEAAAAKYYFGIAPAGEMPGRDDQNTLFVNASMEKLAERLGTGTETARQALESAKARMRAARLAGRRPRIDARAFSGPNLRMAVTLAHAARVMENDAYGERARSIVDFFVAGHGDGEGDDGGVAHVFDGRQWKGPELLRNQVAALEACLAVHELTDDAAYLDRARQLAGRTAVHYRNELAGSYWDTPLDSWGPGLLKTKSRDLPINTRLASALMDITERTGDGETRKEAEGVLKSFSVTFGSKGLSTIPYAAAVHRLFWELRAKSS